MVDKKTMEKNMAEGKAAFHYMAQHVVWNGVTGAAQGGEIPNLTSHNKETDKVIKVHITHAEARNIATLIAANVVAQTNGTTPPDMDKTTAAQDEAFDRIMKSANPHDHLKLEKNNLAKSLAAREAYMVPEEGGKYTVTDQQYKDMGINESALKTMRETADANQKLLVKAQQLVPEIKEKLAGETEEDVSKKAEANVALMKDPKLAKELKEAGEDPEKITAAMEKVFKEIETAKDKISALNPKKENVLFADTGKSIQNLDVQGALAKAKSGQAMG